MGQTISTAISRILGRRQMSVLMLGLDSAGKTTMLWKLKTGETITTIPTIGFNVETVKYKDIQFTVWDVGGQGKIRSLWRHYYQNAEGLIFVVDSADRERIEEAADELHRLMTDDDLRDATLLVLGNKQDLPGAMNVHELVKGLGLNRYISRRWHVQCTCATDGSGLIDALKWMSRALTK